MLLKLSVILDILSDFVDGQINQHPGDFGTFVISDNLFNIFVDEFSSDTHVLRVFLNDSRKDS